jgi:hypothetical protein
MPMHQASTIQLIRLASLVRNAPIDKAILVCMIKRAERATKWIPVKLVLIVTALIYAVLGVMAPLGYSRVNL